MPFARRHLNAGFYTSISTRRGGISRRALRYDSWYERSETLALALHISCVATIFYAARVLPDHSFRLRLRNVHKKNERPHRKMRDECVEPTEIRTEQGALDFADELREDEDHNYHEDQTVNTIEHTTVSGHNLAAILDVRLAFDQRFGKVAQGGRYTDENTE